MEKPNSRPRKTDALILPGVLLTVALLEEIATYKVRQRVHDVYVRTAIIVAFNGIAFTVAAELVGPWIGRTLRGNKAQQESAATSEPSPRVQLKEPPSVVKALRRPRNAAENECLVSGHDFTA